MNKKQPEYPCLAEDNAYQSRNIAEERVSETAEKVELVEALQALNKRLHELNQKVIAMQEEERLRISRELHDSVGQILTTLALSLEMIEKQLPEDFPPLHRSIQEAQELAQMAQGEIHAVSHRLRPPALEALGLNAALAELCQEFIRVSGLHIKYQGSDILGLSETVSISFYRLLQEALANVAKHAQASSVEVVLAREGGEIMLTVKDDGVGFRSDQLTSSPLPEHGLGLLGLQERFNLLGGQLVISSVPGAGTRITGACKPSALSSSRNTAR